MNFDEIKFSIIISMLSMKKAKGKFSNVISLVKAEVKQNKSIDLDNYILSINKIPFP